VQAFWMEWSSVHYIDVFDKKHQVKARDFRGGFVDYLAESQHQAIHLANTKYFDFLPSFCKGFLGVPVDDAYFYAVDRIGMSIFALRSDTEDQWREHRFPFTKSVRLPPPSRSPHPHGTPARPQPMHGDRAAPHARDGARPLRTLSLTAGAHRAAGR
jgi:hypothetical protein